VAAIKAIAAIKKIKKLSAAAAVSLTAFFELCFTVRADSNSLSFMAGAKSNPEHLTPRPCIFVFRKGVGVPPQSPALHISRLVSIGKFMAILIFLVFCFFAFVTSPSGQSFQQLEDGQEWSSIQSASGPGTEPPSSAIPISVNIISIGCILYSVLLIGGMFKRALRKESRYGKEGKGNWGQDQSHA